jgi:hypothetical protein
MGMGKVKTVTVCDIFSNPPVIIIKFGAGAALRYGCKLTIVTKCTFKRKTAPEFSVMLDFSKMRQRISGLLKISGLAISGLAYFEN